METNEEDIDPNLEGEPAFNGAFGPSRPTRLSFVGGEDAHLEADYEDRFMEER